MLRRTAGRCLCALSGSAWVCEFQSLTDPEIRSPRPDTRATKFLRAAIIDHTSESRLTASAFRRLLRLDRRYRAAVDHVLAAGDARCAIRHQECDQLGHLRRLRRTPQRNPALGGRRRHRVNVADGASRPPAVEWSFQRPLQTPGVLRSWWSAVVEPSGQPGSRSEYIVGGDTLWCLCRQYQADRTEQE